ncbi:MAG: DUF4340 domain-containing protein [Planctomycetes bacterium]|nr:DUF4340 domain-containing protein [Planctomycetota bacterium]
MTRSNVVLLVVLLALAGYYFAFERAGSVSGAAPTVTLTLFPEYDPNTAERVEISEIQKVYPAQPTTPDAAKPAKTEPEDKLVTLTLKKAGDQWVVATSGDYPAKPDKVKDALSKIQSFRRGESYSSNPGSHAKFGVDEKGKRVKAFGPGNKLVADFFVGKAGHGLHSTFIRAADSKDVLLVDEPLSTTYATFKNNWFDNAILPAIDPKNVATCEVSWAIPPAADAAAGTAPTTGGVTLARKGDKDWEVTAPESYNAKWNLAEGFVRAITTIRFEDVVKPDASEAGFDKPMLHALVTLADGAKHELFAGAKTKDGKVYLKKAGSEFVFLGNSGLIENLPKRIDGLRELPDVFGPPLPPPDAPSTEKPAASSLTPGRNWLFEKLFREAPVVLVAKVTSDSTFEIAHTDPPIATPPPYRQLQLSAQEVFKSPKPIEQGAFVMVHYSCTTNPGEKPIPIAAFEKERSYVFFLKEDSSNKIQPFYVFAGSPDEMFFDWLADNPLREKARALAGK